MFKAIYNKAHLTISRISGYCQGIYGYVRYANPIQEIQKQLVAEIYDILNGNEEIDSMDPMSVVEFMEHNEALQYAVLRLLIGDQIIMGRHEESSYNLSIYSYAYVAASILMDPMVDADLTFELQDVTEEEYLEYYARLLL